MMIFCRARERNSGHQFSCMLMPQRTGLVLFSHDLSKEIPMHTIEQIELIEDYDFFADDIDDVEGWLKEPNLLIPWKTFEAIRRYLRGTIDVTMEIRDGYGDPDEDHGPFFI